jgi:uncharacterized protein with GYD domain
MRITVLANYTPSAMKGLMDGSDRSAAMHTLFDSVGGSFERLDFTRGMYDVVVSGNVPNQAAAMGVAMAVRASGKIAELVVLEQLDMAQVLAAAKKATYKPPA